jgi:tetratricopeptide (TPR) repeat protein
VRSWMIWASWWGPMTVDESIRLCDETLAVTRSKRVEAHALIMRGAAKAASGRLDEGREDIGAGRGIFRDLGDRIWWSGSSMVEAEVELTADNPQRAYDVVAEGHEILAASAETGYLATVVGLQAHAALDLGLDDEALECAGEARAMAAPDDFEPHARERLVRAQLLARRGDFAGAAELIAAAATLVDPTDYVILHLDLAFARAEVARLAERPDEQRDALERALLVAETKGNVVAAERARKRLAAL